MKFYEIKNITETSADIYIYGEICLEKYVDWWTGEESKTDVALMDFKEELDNLGDNVSKLNLYINSPGGDVYVASAMISMLERLKNKGVTIDAYVDGIAASAASFLLMVADTINLYKNSVVMLHKPMCMAYGNSVDFQKTIDMLEKIENSTMMPMYMAKAKIAENEVKELIANESWLSAEEMDEYFNVNLLTTTNQVAACISKKLFDRYKNVPKNLLENIAKEDDKKLNKQKDEIQDNKKQEFVKNKLKLINATLFIRKNKEN